MATLAEFAYDEGVSLDALFGDSDWRALGSSDLGIGNRFFDAKGYYENRGADGYAARNGATLALVFRGSDSNSDLVASAFNQKDYYDNLKPLIDASFRYIESHDIDTVKMTGHSLGAAMVMRTAAKNDLGDIGDDVSWQMMTFGAPGTDEDNTSADSRSIVNVYHSGDPVRTDPLLDRLTEHGSAVLIQLPNVDNADDLAELARQREDPDRVNEHDMGRYLLSTQTVATSPLYGDTENGTVAVVLDGPDGEALNDVYHVREPNRLVLGLAGNDTLTGREGRDLLDGGSGNDMLEGAAGDDVLSGGSGRDLLSGGIGDDVLAGGIGRDVLNGGAGINVYRFDSVEDSMAGDGGSHRDIIVDFTEVGGIGDDKIDLSRVDANATLDGLQHFTFITGASSAPGQLHVVEADRGGSIIRGEVDGDDRADIAIYVSDGDAAAADWTAADFILM